jgi:hypothetical protein
VNRDTYIESLLAIHEEYQYSNYFLTREVCIQVLNDMHTKQRLNLEREDDFEFDLMDSPSTCILNWLLAKGWLKKMEDYHTLVTNIVIPDYAAIFIEAFERLTSEELGEADVYIQNVYATLFSFQHDPRANVSMLRTALVNIRRLNKALQDMLHNMDQFFARLLQQQSYEALLSEHLEGYVEEIVSNKYHVWKTSDNFYIYKMDIKKMLRQMREDTHWMDQIREQSRLQGDVTDDVLDLLDCIERGVDDIEHRISNMDKEHSKYVRATVTRLHYLLSGETDTSGLMVQLLNQIAQQEDVDASLERVGERMQLSSFRMLSDKSLYKRRRPRQDFIKQMRAEDVSEELDKKNILKLNRIQSRFSQQQIEGFIESHMTDGVMDVASFEVENDETFDQLILAYNASTRKNSKYKVVDTETEMLENGAYRYPHLQFVRR